MKKFYLLIFVVVAISVTSCSEDNYDITTTEALPYLPDTVDLDDLLLYSIPDNDEYLFDGTVYEFTPNSGFTNYCVASNDVTVTCDESIRTSFNGAGQYFQFIFYVVQGEGIVFNANFTAVIDDKVISVFDPIVPGCSTTPIEITYGIEDGRMKGTFTGEFFTFADDIIEPFTDCRNFKSVGVVDIAFDLPIEICN